MFANRSRCRRIIHQTMPNVLNSHMAGSRPYLNDHATRSAGELPRVSGNKPLRNLVDKASWF
jgi:hypothetical protein